MSGGQGRRVGRDPRACSFYLSIESSQREFVGALEVHSALARLFFFIKGKTVFLLTTPPPLLMGKRHSSLAHEKEKAEGQNIES